MAASLVSKCSRASRSLLGGIDNNVSGLLGSSSHQITNSNFMSQQQQRTFIQMRTVLNKVVEALKGKKGARLGDTIVASVKEEEAMPNGKVKKAKVVIVPAAMHKGRFGGTDAGRIGGLEVIIKTDSGFSVPYRFDRNGIK